MPIDIHAIVNQLVESDEHYSERQYYKISFDPVEGHRFRTQKFTAPDFLHAIYMAFSGLIVADASWIELLVLREKPEAHERGAQNVLSFLADAFSRIIYVEDRYYAIKHYLEIVVVAESEALCEEGYRALREKYG